MIVQSKQFSIRGTINTKAGPGSAGTGDLKVKYLTHEALPKPRLLRLIRLHLLSGFHINSVKLMPAYILNIIKYNLMTSKNSYLLKY